MLGNQLAPEETRKSNLDSSVLAPEALITNGQTVELPAARATWGGKGLLKQNLTTHTIKHSTEDEIE